MSQPQFSQQIEPPVKATLDQSKEDKMQKTGSGGEIVQVEGGHIVRSTGRKDRHSKVYTAKGPRDRRVRLSAHTAIEFYDVQDRLGYDRPSKAVDWLIKKAKPSIDKLAELPPWHPTQEKEQNDNAIAIAEQSESCGYNFQHQRQLGESPDNQSPLIPPTLDTDPIAFFPTTSATSSLNFQTYPPHIISSANNSTQDLGLSLHSFHDHHGLIHGQSQQAAAANQPPSNEEHQTLFTASASVGLDNHYQRIVTWNNEGFMVNSHPFLGQGSGSAYSHSGTLQSSFSPSVSSWNGIPMSSSQNHRAQPVSQPSIFGSRFLSDGLGGFCIPEENHGVASNSASPSSHH